jgi:hypothetical protein
VLTRVYGWDFLCDSCYSGTDAHYFPVDYDAGHQTNFLYPKLSTILTHKKTQKICSHCGSQSFLILRDELLDEWLVCVACEQSKQMIRCWNAYKKCYVMSVEAPVIHYSHDGDGADDDSNGGITIGDTESMSDDDDDDGLVNELDIATSEKRGRKASSSHGASSSVSGNENQAVTVSATTAASMSSTGADFFSQFIAKDKPSLGFHWIDDNVPKERSEVTYSDVMQMSDDALKRIITSCGVARRDIELLNKTELVSRHTLYTLETVIYLLFTLGLSVQLYRCGGEEY